MSRKVFVTGATGYLGSAIAARLARDGHEVFGLTRDMSKAAALEAAGIRPVIGDVTRPATYLGTLKNCDDAVHAAIDRSATVVTDQAMLASLLDAAEDGRLRRVLYTSECWVFGPTGDAVADESWPLAPIEHVRWRAAHEDIALDLGDHEVAAVVLRPAIVYGESRGILGGLFAEARDRQRVRWPGDGDHHWGLVHRDDVADAYALALERAHGGERYVLVDESQHTAREVAEAIAQVSGVRAEGWDAEELLRERGGYGEALLTDQCLTAGRARRELGWEPRHGSFVHEVEGHYREWQSSQGTPVG